MSFGGKMGVLKTGGKLEGKKGGKKVGSYRGNLVEERNIGEERLIIEKITGNSIGRAA
jgi:hypothetical protein